MVFTANMQLCFAQKKSKGIPAGGHAKLIVEKAGEKPVTYNFPDALPAAYNCIVHNDGPSIPERYTEIIFIYTFDNGSKQTDVTVSLRIEPNGVGSFPLDPPMPDKPVPSGDINIQFNNTAGPSLMQSPSEGTGGSVTIDNFPKAVGGNITGTFKAKLVDGKGALYNVSGEFNIKRLQ